MTRHEELVLVHVGGHGQGGRGGGGARRRVETGHLTGRGGDGHHLHLLIGHLGQGVRVDRHPRRALRQHVHAVVVSIARATRICNERGCFHQSYRCLTKANTFYPLVFISLQQGAFSVTPKCHHYPIISLYGHHTICN